MPPRSILTVLSPDLLVHVSSFLPLSSLKAFRLVCRAFRGAECLRRSELIVLRHEWVLSLLNRYVALESLDLSKCPRVDDPTLVVVFRSGGVVEFEENQRLRSDGNGDGVEFEGNQRIRSAEDVSVAESGGNGRPRLVGNVDVAESRGNERSRSDGNVKRSRSAGNVDVIELGGNQRLRSNETVNERLRLTGNVDVLEVGGNGRLPRLSEVRMVERELGRLRSVNLSRTMAVSWVGLEALVMSCWSLERLDLSRGFGIGDREMEMVARVKGLRELRVERCDRISDVGLAMVAVGCTGLERLQLSWCVEISDMGVDLLVKKCVGLKELGVSYLKLTNASLLSISTLEKLEVLSMVGCAYINDEGLAYLNNGITSLKSINFSRCVNVSSLGLTSVIRSHHFLEMLDTGYCVPNIAPPFLLKLKSLTQLKTIKLDLLKISVDILQHLGLHSKSLLEISLCKCAGVTDDGISELVYGCSNLRSLDLTCCHLITDGALSAIGRSCKELTCLRVESCILITNKGLEHIGACCNNLQEIDLTECCISDKALEYLSKCSELIELKVAFCPDITNKGLHYIGSNCRKLQVLDLYRCGGIGDDGLISIASGCKDLKKVNICYCTQISDQGLKHLGVLQELSVLEMRRLCNITSAGLTALAVGCKKLVELDLKMCNNIDDMGIWALVRYTQNLRQINVSYCPITDTGLRVLLGNMRCLQDVKLLHLSWVSPEGFDNALRSGWGRLKKVKLLIFMKQLISPMTIHTLEARGCRFKWEDKPQMVE